jgi:hypothetical protein
LIYNDKYAEFADRHPGLFGKRGADGWSEVWNTLGPLSSGVMKGKTVTYVDQLVITMKDEMPVGE